MPPAEPLYTPTHTIQCITLGLLAVWLVGYWWGRLQFRRARVVTADAALILAIVAGSAVIFVTGIVICRARMPVDSLGLPLPATLAGLALVVVGIVGTFTCRRHLGRFWAAEAALQPDHRVVETGPYRQVRHPIYAAAMLIAVGAGVAFGTWWTLLAAGVVAAAYVLKARLEDLFLLAHLPGYRDYQARVRRMFIPGLW